MTEVTPLASCRRRSENIVLDVKKLSFVEEPLKSWIGESNDLKGAKITMVCVNGFDGTLGGAMSSPWEREDSVQNAKNPTNSSQNRASVIYYKSLSFEDKALLRVVK
ncbi:hypothetical protein Tco_0127292 [Tanacetum coccineum]